MLRHAVEPHVASVDLASPLRMDRLDCVFQLMTFSGTPFVVDSVLCSTVTFLAVLQCS